MIRNISLGIYFLGFLLFSAGCVPAARTVLSPGSGEDLQDCLTLFPPGPWESVHKIEVLFGGGNSFTMIGVTKGDPSVRLLHSLLLTPEGFTLFEGDLREGEIIVRKAVPPFDSPAFSKGMMEDVAFLFFSPLGSPVSWGKAMDGTRVCRWGNPDGFQTETRETPDQGRGILRRDDQGRATKKVSLKGPFVQGLAADMELQVLRPVSYTLKMTLVQSGP
ncbi:MAG: hypothetical protein HY879_07795 [Deltaproteobacteria bacterium]|nr:hypothetical protein [Deltaproteobacteria bacterium]